MKTLNNGNEKYQFFIYIQIISKKLKEQSKTLHASLCCYNREAITMPATVLIFQLTQVQDTVKHPD
jgi:hypothetical protein